MADKQVSFAFTRTYPPDTVLFEEYDLGSRMYVIRRGRVKIFRRHQDQTIVLAMLGPGDFFGEMALLENLPRSASAQVVEESELIEVDAQTFEDMIRGNSEIAVRMMRKLASRVRELDRRLQNLLVESGVGRAVEVLRWLLPTGTPEGDFVRIPGTKAHVNIASQAGMSLAEAEEVLVRLKDAGCVKTDGNDVLVANAKLLDEYSQFLDLKRKYEPSVPRAVSTVAEPLSPGKDDVNPALRRLLRALEITRDDVELRQAALAGQYKQYTELKQRFEPGDQPEG